MYDGVPGALQRLREADIVSMAGLTAASLGQEYCRIGTVHAAKRRGAQLSGIVEVPGTSPKEAATTTNGSKETGHAPLIPGHYAVEVEVLNHISCNVTCACNQSPAQTSVVCSHAAALLYHWLARPLSFANPSVSNSSLQLPFEHLVPDPPLVQQKDSLTFVPKQPASPTQAREIPALQGPSPTSNTAEILAQSGLSEIRSIAREYEITTNGLSKQQLIEAIVEALKQPEAVRRVVATLEKQQRQLLAALTLAGGSMNDEDLRGLFERFSLGRPGQLQSMLLVLQDRALIVRTTLNNSLQQRIGLSGSPFDISWHVPSEVRAALHVSLPITPFKVEAGGDKDSTPPKIQQVEPYSLLQDLLLVARVLDGNRLDREEKRSESARAGNAGRLPDPPPLDGSMPVPLPNTMPPAALLESLQAVVPRSLSFLRFAIRSLRMADILYRDDGGTPGMRALPNAAELLLGPTRVEVAHELFTHWLHQTTYEELFDLQEEGLRLRCRATPALRPGELETENREARQTLVALLAQAPLDQWISFPAFARFVYRLNPTFLQKRQRLFSSPHWWIEQEEGRPLHPTQLTDWLRAEGRYLAHLLQGPLHWWGISDIVLSTDERLLAFRLTPLAASFLHGAPVGAQFIEPNATSGNLAPNTTSSDVAPGIAPGTLPAIAVTEVGDLLIPSTFANWSLIDLIERFAEVKGVLAGQLCYRLTPKSLSAAFSRGESPTTLLEILRHVAGQPISAPDSPMARLLAQLERRIASYGRVRLYTDVSLLEAADQLTLRELSATTSFDEQVVHPIHPTLLILKKQAIDRLVDELKRRGQVPLLHEAVDTGFFAFGAEELYGTK
jgi:hypothetical protein